MADDSCARVVKAYKADLTKAFNCFDRHSLVQFSGNYGIGEAISWRLRGSRADEPDFIRLPGHNGEFSANQTLRFVECDPVRFGSSVRLQTEAYFYTLDAPDGREEWAIHWHPQSAKSRVQYPHIHVKDRYGSGHLRTGRLLLEHAIHWAMVAGATPRPGIEWEDLLSETIRRHENQRQWS